MPAKERNRATDGEVASGEGIGKTLLLGMIFMMELLAERSPLVKAARPASAGGWWETTRGFESLPSPPANRAGGAFLKREWPNRAGVRFGLTAVAAAFFPQSRALCSCPKY